MPTFSPSFHESSGPGALSFRTVEDDFAVATVDSLAPNSSPTERKSKLRGMTRHVRSLRCRWGGRIARQARFLRSSEPDKGRSRHLVFRYRAQRRGEAPTDRAA